MIMFTAGFVTGLVFLVAYALIDNHFFFRRRMKRRFDEEVRRILKGT